MTAECGELRRLSGGAVHLETYPHEVSPGGKDDVSFAFEKASKSLTVFLEKPLERAEDFDSLPLVTTSKARLDAATRLRSRRCVDTSLLHDLAPAEKSPPFLLHTRLDLLLSLLNPF